MNVNIPWYYVALAFILFPFFVAYQFGAWIIGKLWVSKS